MALVVQHRRLEHAGEPIAFGTVLQLVAATSKAHPPAQGRSLHEARQGRALMGKLRHRAPW